jgi:hypothetical protein
MTDKVEKKVEVKTTFRELLPEEAYPPYPERPYDEAKADKK